MGVTWGLYITAQSLTKRNWEKLENFQRKGEAHQLESEELGLSSGSLGGS